MIGFKLRVPWSTSGKTAAQKIQAETPPGRSDEAIHEAARKEEWIALRSCHRARIRATRWLAMTARRNLAFPQRIAPEVCKENSCPHQKEGAGKAGCALHPRSRVQNCAKKAHTSIQVQRRQSDFPCAMVLTAASCSPRRSGFFVIVALRVFSQDLTPASRRQDHTTWPSASQRLRPCALLCVHRIPTPRMRRS